jgi:predicted phage terminase large subunit-like protein
MAAIALPEEVRRLIPPGADPERYIEAIKIAMARKRLLPFVQWTFPQYHISRAHTFLAEELEKFERAVEAGESPRLAISLSPRFGKSELITRRFTGWTLGRHPDWSLGIISYGAELAEELSADARRVVMSDEYQAVFGKTYQPESDSTVELDRQSKAVNYWRIAGRKGSVRAVGVGGAITGRGFQICVIDDPIKGREEADNLTERDKLWKWYRGTLRTRVEPGGGILIVHTRWHHDDLLGRLEEHRPGHWKTINLPAIADEDDPLGREPGEPLDARRFDLDALADIKEDVGERDWSAQYQGKPTPDEGDVFKRDWFKNVADPEPEGKIYQYWDSAHGKRNPKRKGDRSVCTTWRRERNKYRLIGIWIGRPGYPELKKKAIELRERHKARALIIEDHSSGQSLIQDLRNDTRIPVLPWKTGNESKVERAKSITDEWETGTAVCSLPEHLFEAVVKEHLEFPNGKYDDIVDSCSMALAHMAVWNAQVRTHVTQREFRIVA